MLRKTLETIVEKVHGTAAVMVMGLDGFVIDQHVEPGNDLVLEAVAAEVASIFRQAQTSSGDLRTGEVEEINFRTDRHYILLHRITEDYLLCLIMAAGENYGRARFELRKASALLLEEFMI